MKMINLTKEQIKIYESQYGAATSEKKIAAYNLACSEQNPYLAKYLIVHNPDKKLDIFRGLVSTLVKPNNNLASIVFNDKDCLEKFHKNVKTDILLYGLQFNNLKCLHIALDIFKLNINDTHFEWMKKEGITDFAFINDYISKRNLKLQLEKELPHQISSNKKQKI